MAEPGRRHGGLRGAVAAEWRKVRRQRFPLLSIVLVGLATLAAGVSAGRQEQVYEVNGFLVLCVAARWGFQAAGLLVLLYAATSVAGEATAGTLKLVLVRPIGRGRYLLAKVVVVLLLVVALAVVASVVAWLLGLTHGGYGDIYSEGLGGERILDMEASRIADKPLVALGLSVLPVLAFAALGLLISCITTSSASAVMAAILTCLPLFVIPPFLALVKVPLPPEILGLHPLVVLHGDHLVFTFHATVYLEQVAELARGHAETWGLDYYGSGLVVPPLYTLALLGAAFTIFRRKDIAL